MKDYKQKNAIRRAEAEKRKTIGFCVIVAVFVVAVCIV